MQAIRVLFTEAHDGCDRHELIWAPNQLQMDMLAAQNPEEIVCLCEDPVYGKNTNGCSCNVYMVAPEKKIIYLGTVVNRKRAHLDFNRLKKALPHKTKQLKKGGPFAIARQQTMCSIPMDADILTPEVIQQGVRKYLWKFAPKLAEIPLKWLPKKRQTEITQEIFYQALTSAKRQTREERVEIYSNDF